MPDLPEVESIRRVMERKILHNTVKYAYLMNMDGKNELIFTKSAIDFIEKDMMGKKVKEVGRWGKQLWILFQDATKSSENYNDTMLLINLEMTGYIQLAGNDGCLHESCNFSPRFTKLHITFDNDAEMALGDTLRSTKVDVIKVPTNLARGSAKFLVIRKFELGFDPLIGLPNLEKFSDRLRCCYYEEMTIKAVLMRQRFLADICNWLADEILLLAGILPQRIVSTIKETEIRRLYNAIKDVSQIAVAVEMRKGKMPAEWLYHMRWDLEKTETLTGLSVLSANIEGRDTFWVPELQK